jgi:hypothetical protein
MKFNLLSLEELIDWKIGQVSELKDVIESEPNPIVKNFLKEKLEDDIQIIMDSSGGKSNFRDGMIDRIVE